MVGASLAMARQPAHRQLCIISGRNPHGQCEIARSTLADDCQDSTALRWQQLCVDDCVLQSEGYTTLGC